MRVGLCVWWGVSVRSCARAGRRSGGENGLARQRRGAEERWRTVYAGSRAGGADGHR
ncbi:hypothetical protein CERSUDRAFT_87600 [Gelatoporia subvermispora B]|uniref:Uncharacterized protein n=1 Tax=Ceriporiopsis subvermispora (strain B) TaxID=914234 RepID=M2R3T4_CERS8|nr:hypothetical protein CERSUDRAFT_87600 [Gelatoporia subvermispora B]